MSLFREHLDRLVSRAPRCAAGLLLAALLLAPAPARGGPQGGADAETRAEARALVEALRRADSDEARRDLYTLGRPALEALAGALATEARPAVWSRLADAFESLVRDRVRELDERIAARSRAQARSDRKTPLGAPQGEEAALQKALEEEVRAGGYAAARELARPGGGQDRLVSLARAALVEDLARALSAELKALGPEAAPRATLQARLVKLGPLIAPLLRRLLTAGSPPARTFAAAVRDAQIQSYLRGLSTPDSEGQRLARAGLFELGELARPALEAEVRSAKTPHRRYQAEELLQRIRWGISAALYRRTGDLLYGFEELDWQARRLKVFELEKQGQSDAIGALRRVLAQDPSPGVRLIAAEGLARLGDERGLAYLRSLGRQLLRQSPEILAAIAMDQGIRYLQIRRYQRALREFAKVLELQPKNETALYNLGCAHALMGDKGQALTYLERAVAAGFADADHMQSDTDLESLQEEPRFRKLIQRLRAGDSPGPSRR